jgi:hypothetical protein
LSSLLSGSLASRLFKPKNVNSRDTGADGHRERLPQRENSFDDLVVALAFG